VWHIEEEEMTKAIELLGNKAVGIDGLKDTNLKKILLGNDRIKNKLKEHIQLWLTNGSIPTYLKHARAIAISKSSSCYPKVGEIRTISILPALSKLVERIINFKIEKEIKEKQLIHAN
jgi:hypothetical protein